MRGTGIMGLVVLAAVGLSVSVFAQGEDPHMPMGPPDEMKEMEKFNGVWDVVFKYKMDPAGDWQTSNGLATFKMIADGAAQQMDYNGEMMGMKFTGVGVTSYNRQTKKWQNTWVDSISGYLSYYEGGPEGDNLVFNATETMHGMTIHSRMTTHNISDNEFEWKMEMSMDGETYMTQATAVYTKR